MFFVDETVPTWVPDVIREFIEKLASSIGLTPFITFWVCVGAVALLLIILIIIICVIKKKNENKRFKKEKEYQDRRMAAREAEKKEQEEKFASNPDPFAEPSTPKSNVSANDSDEDEYELATEDEGSSKNASDDDDSLVLFDDDFEEIKQQYVDEKDTEEILDENDFNDESLNEDEAVEEEIATEEEKEETSEEVQEEQPIVEEDEPVEEDVAIEEEVPEVQETKVEEETPVVEEPKEEVPPVVEEKKPAKKAKKAPKKASKKAGKEKQEKPVEEVVVTEEEKEEVAKEETPVIEETPVVEEVQEEVPVEEEKPVEEETPVVEEKEEPSPVEEVKPVKSASKTTTAKGKYIITAESERNFRYILKASNGEPLITSEIYVSEESARKGIDTIKRNVNTAKIEIVEDKHGLFSFRVITKQGSRTLATSANYKTKARAVSASESFKRFVESETIIVDTSQVTHEQAELYNVEITTEARGKFNIVEVTPNKEYMYQLLASNGRIIASSQIYKSKLSCKQACDKLREVAYTGEFYIFKDKNEQYQFKLYNKQHRLVLAGEVYNSKDRVISVINSIKRFAEKAQFVENQPVSE